MRQTLSSGIMMDYDATAAFDRVLHAMSIISCRQISLPHKASMFMLHLLQSIEFYLLTGYSISSTSFHNKEDPHRIGQGMYKAAALLHPCCPYLQK
jgi:hypothetical protein